MTFRINVQEESDGYSLICVLPYATIFLQGDDMEELMEMFIDAWYLLHKEDKE